MSVVICNDGSISGTQKTQKSSPYFLVYLKLLAMRGYSGRRKEGQF